MSRVRANSVVAEDLRRLDLQSHGTGSRRRRPGHPGRGRTRWTSPSSSTSRVRGVPRQEARGPHGRRDRSGLPGAGQVGDGVRDRIHEALEGAADAEGPQDPWDLRGRDSAETPELLRDRKNHPIPKSPSASSSRTREKAPRKTTAPTCALTDSSTRLQDNLRRYRSRACHKTPDRRGRRRRPVSWPRPARGSRVIRRARPGAAVAVLAPRWPGSRPAQRPHARGRSLSWPTCSARG